MSIFKRIYGRRIPATKMDAENPSVEGETQTPAPTPTATPATEAATTEPLVTTTDSSTETTAVATTTTEPTTITTNGDVPTTVTTATSNGAPRSFQFGAKAKMFRDMIAQHRLKLDSDQTQLLCIIGMLGLALMCSLTAIGTDHWQCQGQDHYGLWNTCQKQTALTLPDVTANSTENNTATLSSAVMCVHHNAQNQLELVIADQSRIDQVQASQGLIICGTIMYIASLLALIFAYRFIKTKPSRSLNMMRNLLVTAIFTQILSFLLQLVGFFLYILTERISTSVGLLFVYFGLALCATNVINFITIEYKAYKMRQQQVQIN